MFSHTVRRLAFVIALAGAAHAIVPCSTALARPLAAPEANAGTVNEESRVVSQGRAVVSRVPDYVDVVVGVEITADSASDAQAQCTKAMEEVIKAVKALNLPGIELRSGRIELGPRYNDFDPRNNGGPRKVIGYNAVNTLRVRTTDLKAPPRTIDAALKAGANRVDMVSYAIKEALAAREEALALATAAAARKAGVLAGALNTRLGRVVTVTESGGGNSYMAQNRVSKFAAESDAPVTGDSVEPGTIDISVDVTVEFALVPKG
jgi:uncharacterized protein YggE